MHQLKQSIRKLQVAAYRDPSISPEIAPFGHSYPWQLYTRWKGVEVSAKLQREYPVDKLKAELEELLANFAPKEQFGHYHRGGWSGIALHALDGDPAKDHDVFEETMEKTPALKFAPTMERIIDSFPTEKRRVRILRLAPGKQIFWHSDFWHSIDSKMIRLHIPIVTNAKVGFQIAHEDCVWQPGELWYGDFTFPHRLENGGDADRIHLVLDLMNNDAISALLPDSLKNQRELRCRARARSDRLLRSWNHIFATEARLSAARKRRG